MVDQPINPTNAIVEKKLHLPPGFSEFLKHATPQALIDYETPLEFQARAAELAARKTSDDLSEEEAAELEQILEFDLFLITLKAEAREALKEHAETAPVAFIPVPKPFLDRLFAHLSPDQILALEPTEPTNLRIEELLYRNSNHELTDDEHGELENLLAFHTHLSEMKAAALAAEAALPQQKAAQR